MKETKLICINWNVSLTKLQKNQKNRAVDYRLCMTLVVLNADNE